MCCHLDEETVLIELLKEVDSGLLTVKTWSFINLIEIPSALEGRLSVNTVFCRIHAPARTPKSPEGRLYSGLITSLNQTMLGGFRDSRICSFVFNGGKIACSCVLNSLK